MTNQGEAAEVADRVRQASEAAGLSTNRLADLAGIPYPTLRRRLNTAPQLFTVDELVRIANATGSDLAYLASGGAAA